MKWILLICIIILIAGCESSIDKNGKFLGSIHTHLDLCEPPAGDNDHEIYVAKNLEKHTKYFDELARLEMDFIFITDHNIIDENLRDKCLKENRFLCLLGEEISTSEGHIVGLGLKKQIDPWMGLNDTLNEIHKQNGIAIVAHPFWKRDERISLSEEVIMEFKDSIDAIECGNFGVETRGAFKAKSLEDLGLPCVYVSDSHNIDHLQESIEYNLLCDLDELSEENIKNAILSGKCEKSEKFDIKKENVPSFRVKDLSPKVKECLVIQGNEFIPLGNICGNVQNCIDVSNDNELNIPASSLRCVESKYTKVSNVVRCSNNNECINHFSYMNDKNKFVDIEETVICENSFCKMLGFTEEKHFRDVKNLGQCVREENGESFVMGLLCKNDTDCGDGHIDREICWNGEINDFKFRCVNSEFKQVPSGKECISRVDCNLKSVVKDYDEGLIHCRNNICETAEKV